MNALDSDMMEAMIAGQRLKTKPVFVRSFYQVKGVLVQALIWAISAQRQTKQAVARNDVNHLPSARTAKPICRKKLPASGAKSGCPLLRPRMVLRSAAASGLRRRHRFAAPGTKFSIMEIVVGSVPDMAPPMLWRVGTRRHFRNSP